MSEETIESASYVSLATFRKDGRKVATPIWAAPLADSTTSDTAVELVMFSDPQAGKVKRLRNSPRAEVAICDVRGKLLGDWMAAQAFLVEDPVAVAGAERAMRNKYGWQSRLLDTISRIGGRLGKRQYIRIVLTDSGSEKQSENQSES